MSTDLKSSEVTESQAVPRWRRWLRLFAASFVVLLLLVAYSIKDHVRTLASLRRVPNTNAYVMDYYVDYHGEELRTKGMDVQNIEDSYLEILFPDVILPIATRLKRRFVPSPIKVVDRESHHCSTMFLESSDGDRFFGRNQDYGHDAALVLRIHDNTGVVSVSVIDLAYLNLDRDDLDQTNFIERIPLLFSPYYVMDGMNRHGLAVGILSVPRVDPPRTAGNPKITHSSLMRVLLDNARTTEEAVNLIRQFDIHFVDTPQHAFISDATGDSRIVEYLDGELRESIAAEGWQICTNREMSGYSDEEIDSQCHRYRTGSERAEQLAGHATAEDARATIRSMYVDGWTMWTSLYNLTTGEYSVTYRAAIEDDYRDQLSIQQ